MTVPAEIVKALMPPSAPREKTSPVSRRSAAPSLLIDPPCVRTPPGEPPEIGPEITTFSARVTLRAPPLRYTGPLRVIPCSQPPKPIESPSQLPCV